METGSQDLMAGKGGGADQNAVAMQADILIVELSPHKLSNQLKTLRQCSPSIERRRASLICGPTKTPPMPK